jgi:hypothetical protein
LASDNEASFRAGKNILSQMLNAAGPDKRITAIPPIPGGVDMAQIVVSE